MRRQERSGERIWKRPGSTGRLHWFFYCAAQPLAPYFRPIDRWQASWYAVMRLRERWAAADRERVHRETGE